MDYLETDGGTVLRGDPGEPGNKVPRIGIDRAEADILAELAAGLFVLEIGTGIGISTRALAATAELVHTVDIDPWVHTTVWPHLPENVETYEAVPTPLRTIDKYTFAFVDGCHHYNAVVEDIKACLRVVAPSALVVFHDWDNGDVRRAIQDHWPCGQRTHYRSRYGMVGVRVPEWME